MRTQETADALIRETDTIIIGKRATIRLVLSAILSGGHVLLEDLPGIAARVVSAAGRLAALLLSVLRALIGALASLVYRLLLLLPLPQEEIRKPEAVPGAAAEYRRAFRKSRRDHRKKAGGKPCP